MDYQKEALRTLNNEDQAIYLTNSNTVDLLHAAIGIGTEAGEILDVLKRFLFYGKEIDRTNLIEELGDLEWYAAVMREALGVTQEEVQHLNIQKLRARYPERFTKEAALNRDLDKEREALENS